MSARPGSGRFPPGCRPAAASEARSRDPSPLGPATSRRHSFSVRAALSTLGLRINSTCVWRKGSNASAEFSPRLNRSRFAGSIRSRLDDSYVGLTRTLIATNQARRQDRPDREDLPPVMGEDAKHCLDNVDRSRRGASGRRKQRCIRQRGLSHRSPNRQGRHGRFGPIFAVHRWGTRAQGMEGMFGNHAVASRDETTSGDEGSSADHFGSTASPKSPVTF